MSSSSCALFNNVRSRYYKKKREEGDQNDEIQKDSDRKRYNIVGALMWALGSVLVSCNVELSANSTGILVSATILNVVQMLIATLLLGKGLKDSNSFYVLPWILISFWSMYQIQFRDIVKLYKTLDLLQITTKLPWLSLAAYGAALLARFHLTLAVSHLALQQWYNKKLLQEVCRS